MAAGTIIIGSTFVGALLFRTHGYEVTPFSLELLRHFNILFMLSEVVVVGLAFHAGLDLAAVWNKLAPGDKGALLIWSATFWIGSVLSQQPAYSLVTVSSWPIHILFGVSVWHVAGRARLPLEQANRSIAAGVTLVTIGLLAITAAHFLQDPKSGFLLPGGKVFWAGAIPGFLSVRLFGVVMAFAGLLGAGILLSGREVRQWRLPAMLLLLGFGAMCWSSTRAALPAFFVALLILPFLVGSRPSGRSCLIVGVVIVAAFCLSILAPAPDSAYGTLQLFAGDAGTGGGDLMTGRMEIWRAAIGAIWDRPLIGHGEGSIRWLLEIKSGGHVQPHNVVLQLFLHWGIAAASAAIWLCFKMVLAMIAAARRVPGLLPYAMVVVAAGVAALFDGALYYPQMVMFPIAALAFTLAKGTAQEPMPATG